MVYFRKILLVFLAFFCLFISQCYAVEWSQQNINDLLHDVDEIHSYIIETYGALENINSYVSTLDERQQLIFSEIKTMHSDMNSKFDKLQAGVSAINTNIVYCLTNLQQIKQIATEMSTKLDSLQAGLKEINTNIQYCLQNLQLIRSQIDTINDYLDSIDSNIKDIRDAIITTNEKVDQTNEKLDNINTSITDDNIDDNTSTLPGDTTEDITSDGFNDIFTLIYNTFTSGSSQDVVITIPFTNKSFTINVDNVYSGANLGFVKVLIELFWYFIISYFIVQDVGKKINKIKSGDIEHVQDTNIKEDLL